MQCKQEKVLILSVDQPRIKVGLWQRRSGNTEHCVAKGEASNNAVPTGEGTHFPCVDQPRAVAALRRHH